MSEALDTKARNTPTCRAPFSIDFTSLGKNEEQTNPLEARQDIVSDVMEYCSRHDFIFVASVNSTWMTTWRGCGRLNYTSVHLALTTPARTEQVLNMDDPDFDRTADKLGGVFALVARAGNLDGLKLSTRRYGRCWILERSTRLLTVFAARNGHIHILEWAHERGCPWGVDTFRSAARGGNIAVMQWLLDNNCSWDASTCASAAMGGYLEALQWAKENECPWDENTCKNSALKGHLDMLQWAREKQCPWDKKTCENAALGGHLDVLQWAHSQCCPWSEKVCSNAALGGHLEVLMWARAQGCPWNEDTCSAAAKCGHLDVLKWARANKCPWDASTLEQAFRRGHMEVYNWAVEHGCQGWSPRSRTRPRYFSETL